MPPFLALAEALEEVLGADVANTYRDGPWGFGDAAALAQLAKDGGFKDVQVRKHELPLIFEGGPGQLLLTLHAAAVAPMLALLSDTDQLSLARAVEFAARSITVDGAVRSHAASHILTATASAA